jgi:cellulose synthase/poly-beta-1,6-N-acetylglucosamine synthase-like glycosyltransferase
MTRVFADVTISGAKGVYRSRQRSLVARFVQQEYQDKYDRMATLPAIDFIDTYSAAYRRAVFVASGGFDTSFTTASVEDQEFSFRLTEQGHRLVLVPEAIVYHQHDATLSEYVRRKYGIGYWKPLVLRRHPGKAIKDSHTPQSIKVQIVLLAIAIDATLLTILVPGFAVLAVSAWLLLLSTMLPLLIKIARRDAAVLGVAPLMIGLRAFGLGAGLTIGLIRFNLLPRRNQV